MFGRTFGFSTNTTKSGWVLGGGAEYQVTPNILLRGEYLYYKFNGFSASEFETSQIFTWNSFNVQVARIAASYKL
jgi:opacity protein-like surface antigen